MAAIYIKAVDKLDRVLEWLVGILFIAMFLSAVVQVVVRNFTSLSVPWTDEACRFIVMYLVYFGAALAARNNSMIKMEIMDTIFHLSPKAKQKMNWLITAISTVFVVTTVISSLNIIQTSAGMITSALRISWAIPYVSIPIGCVLLILNILANTLEEGRKSK
ncbi:TRAP transporter small permease [Hominifimenecus sp. rT4P-3]|uniref:TRAP transporter small permease n=1 Tax=Hominifimenecus sp. rT4P-3 TaxID=3242979 RepID=UPI003DA20593